jgi:hypothetical protein
MTSPASHSCPLHAPCPTPLLQASARRVTKGSIPKQEQEHHTMANATSQHHHPACEPLLAGGDGGADDDGTRMSNDDANEQTPMNKHQ